MRHDLFISHASEDKESVAKPLAEELAKRGYQVWFDDFELKIGDSLSRTIDQGLAESRYGVVILSKSFFLKRWPERELSGLVSREMASGGKVILPVWHKVTTVEVSKYSPPLADRLAADTREGIAKVADKIASVLGSAHPPTTEASEFSRQKEGVDKSQAEIDKLTAEYAEYLKNKEGIDRIQAEIDKRATESAEYLRTHVGDHLSG